MLIQKEMAEDQVRHLTSQLEESKETLEELRDRLGNFKVQAQGREVGVLLSKLGIIFYHRSVISPNLLF